MHMEADNKGAYKHPYLFFSGIEFFYWFASAVGGYLVVYLQSRGMNGTQQGIMNASMSVIGIIGAAFLGALCDKIHSERKVMLLCLSVGILTWLFVPTMSGIAVFGIPLVMLVVPICSFFRSPTMSIKDSWVVSGVNRRNLNYGAIRLWGSVGYAVVSILLSFILPHIGVKCTFYLYAAASIPLIVLICKGKDDRSETAGQKKRKISFNGLYTNYYYMVCLVFGFMFYLAFSTTNSFVPYLISAVGDDSSRVGVIYGYRAAIEIPTLLCLSRLKKKLPLQTIIPISALFFAADCILNRFATGLFVMVLNSTFTGIGNGLFIGTVTNYVYQLAPEELQSTAQTVFASTSSLAGIVGFIIGGRLLDVLGARSFFLTAGIVLVLASAFFVVSHLIGKSLKKQ